MMKKSILLLILFISMLASVFSQSDESLNEIEKYEIFSSKGFKGLKYNGEIILDAKYKDILEYAHINDFIVIVFEDYIKLFSVVKRKTLDLKLSNISIIDQSRPNYYYVGNKGLDNTILWGIIDKYGTIVLPINFTYISIISNNSFIADSKDNWFLYQFNGEMLYHSDKQWSSHNSYIIEKRNIRRISSDAIGYNITIIDTLGNIRYKGSDNHIFTSYSFRSDVDFLIYSYIPSDKIGVLSFPDGVSVIDPSYFMLVWYTDDLLIGTNNGVKGLVNLNDEEILPFEFSFISPRIDSYGIAKSAIDDQYYVLDSNGEVTSSLKDYSDVSINFFNDGVCFVAKNNKWGLVDSTGREILECQYDDFVDFKSDEYGETTTYDIAFVGYRKYGSLYYTPINIKGEYINYDLWFSIPKAENSGERYTRRFWDKKYMIISQGDLDNLIDLNTGDLFCEEWFGPEKYKYHNGKKLFKFTFMENGNLILKKPDSNWYQMNEKGETFPLN